MRGTLSLCRVFGIQHPAMKLFTLFFVGVLFIYFSGSAPASAKSCNGKCKRACNAVEHENLRKHCHRPGDVYCCPGKGSSGASAMSCNGRCKTICNADEYVNSRSICHHPDHSYCCKRTGSTQQKPTWIWG